MLASTQWVKGFGDDDYDLYMYKSHINYGLRFEL